MGLTSFNFNEGSYCYFDDHQHNKTAYRIIDIIDGRLNNYRYEPEWGW